MEIEATNLFQVVFQYVNTLDKVLTATVSFVPQIRDANIESANSSQCPDCKFAPGWEYEHGFRMLACYLISNAMQYLNFFQKSTNLARPSEYSSDL